MAAGPPGRSRFGDATVGGSLSRILAAAVASVGAVLLSITGVSPSRAISTRLIGAAGGASVADFAVTTIDDIVNGDVSSPQALLADPGPDGISLREAILAADNAGGHQTITFSPALAGETISPGRTYNVYQPGVTIEGSLTDGGQPAVTLTDGSNGDAFMFGVYASDLSISGLRMVDFAAGAAISIDAGETFSPQSINDVTIENNVFDNTLAPTGRVNAIYLSMPSTAADAEISNVAVVGNSFDGFLNGSDGVLAAVGGSGDVIRKVEVEGNSFTDSTFPVEFVGADASNSRIEDARVVRNTFVGSLQPVNINQIGTDGRPTTTGNVIEGTLVAQNTFRNDRGPDVVILGGMTNATNNSITNTTIQDNLMTGSTEFGGVAIVGGRQESTGNVINGVQLSNNTIVENVGDGVGAQDNLDGGSNNSVTGVTAVNSIVADNTVDFGGLSPAQVSLSLTDQSGYVGTNGNVNGDPRFVDPSSGDFHLRAGSPAIDAGTSAGASATDLECRSRLGQPDMGAFEFGGTPTTCPPPSTTIDAHPPSSTQLRNAEFSFESNTASSTFECKLDAGTFTACTSPANYSGLSQGQHTFQVRAVDPDGNWDPDPASFSWTLTAPGPPPSVSSFTPVSGLAGTSVTLSGSHFTGVTAVTFGGTATESFTVNSDSQITAVVARGTTTGHVSVTSPGGTATSARTFIVPAQPPVVRAASPSEGLVGATVQILGQHFTGATVIRFNATAAVTFTVMSDDSIVAVVPVGATSGHITVMTQSGSSTSATVFTVLPMVAPSPTITSFTPTSGVRGVRVLIRGTGFTGATLVTFSGVRSTYKVVNQSTIYAIVPVGATTGPIVVTTPGGTAGSATSFVAAS